MRVQHGPLGTAQLDKSRPLEKLFVMEVPVGMLGSLSDCGPEMMNDALCVNWVVCRSGGVHL